MKDRAPAFFLSINAFNHQGVKMNVEVDRASESLHYGDAPTFAQLKTPSSGLLPLKARNGTDDNPQNASHQVRISRHPVSELNWERHNPLPNRCIREYPVRQEGSLFAHPARTTRGTESPAFTGKGDKLFMFAVIALKSHETVSQHSAAQKGFELSTHVRREVPSFRFPLLHEASPVFLDQPVKECLPVIAGAIGAPRWACWSRCLRK